MAGLVIVASAGSGKTTHLVDRAVAEPRARILITTFTNENTDNIRSCLIERFGYLPSNITVSTWFSVLLSEGVRPYQNVVSGVELSKSVAFVPLPQGARMAGRERDPDRFFFAPNGDVYGDRASDFACFADDQTGGLVISRLAGMYTHILIDELQDFAGYDLTLFERMFASGVQVIAVGDPRQATFATNRGNKNRAVKGTNIGTWIEKLGKANKIAVGELTDTWRSNQVICDFADALFPHLPGAKSKNTVQTGHDGVFEITRADAVAYFEQHGPTVLRWDKNTDTLGLPAMNIGLSKGRTYDRVMIFPTNPMKEYLKKRDPAVAGDLSKLYVAVTRARYSVAFVVG